MSPRNVRRIPILAGLMLTAAHVCLGQGTIGEAFVSTGGSLKPGGAPTLSAGFAGGWGERSIVSISVGYSRLGDYALGLGRSIYQDNPISQSRIWTLEGDFQLETIPRSRAAPATPYISLGGGYLFERFTARPPSCCLAPTPPRQGLDRHVLSPSFGGGVRFPVSATLGVRPEIKVWIVRARTGTDRSFKTESDSFVTVTISFYYRGGQSARRARK
jgi:hypothetical protein